MKKRLWSIIGLLAILSSFLIGCSPSHNGLNGPSTLGTTQKSEAIAIAIQAPQIASIIEKPTPYTIRLGWMAIVWNGSEVGQYNSFSEDPSNTPNFQVPTGSLWYPEVIVSTGTETITQAQIAVDLGTRKVVYVDGPYPSLSSPGRFGTSTPAGKQ